MWLNIFLVLLLASVSFSSLLLPSDDAYKNRQHVSLFLDIIAKGLDQHIQNFTSTGYKSDFYKEYEKNLLDESENSQPYVLSCLACRSYVTILMRDRNNGASETDLGNSATNMCGIVTSYTPQVCRGAVFANVEPMVFILDSRPTLTANQICTMILAPDCGTIDASFDFRANISPGNAITGPKTVSSPRSSNELKIVHVTDLHYDEDYLEGTNAVCGDPVCCRRNNGVPSNPADRAGHWMDFRDCDSPWRGVEDALRRIRQQHPDADVIYHTGDIVDHAIWENNRQTKLRSMDRVYTLFKTVFGNTPVFHVLGNHEANPVNVFAPTTVTRASVSSSWLYDYSASTWQRHGWINAAAAATVRSHGHYTQLVRPGFRVIGLNNNVCATYNWWLLYSRSDALHSIQWLHDTLLAAERANERVHILKHHPAGGGGCVQFWSREYRRVIDRFHRTIGAQFTGHSHRDEFEIFYDSATSTHAINVAWNGGAATGYVGINPNYVLYHVDPVHYQVNEKESFIYHINEANRTPTQNPRWFRQYSFRQAFGVTDFSPASLDRFLFTMSRDRRISRRYWEYKVKAGPPHMARGCNDDCLRGHVCRIAINNRGDMRRCNQVLAVFGTVA